MAGRGAGGTQRERKANDAEKLLQLLQVFPQRRKGIERKGGIMMLLGYADPPYIGRAYRYGCEEVDHVDLLKRLEIDYKGWALSCAADSLEHLHKIAPKGTRTIIWVRPDAFGQLSSKSSKFAYCYEGVIYKPARVPMVPTVGYLVASLNKGLSNDQRKKRKPTGSGMKTGYKVGYHQRHGRRNVGSMKSLGIKPEAFCFWVFDNIGARPGDELHDLFPGSGGVMRAWKKWEKLRSRSLDSFMGVET